MAESSPTSSERSRRLAAGIIASLTGKAISLAAPLLMVPVTYGYLGASRFGLWMATASLTGMAVFADLGLGNGLLTRLSRWYATGDTKAAARDTASAYLVLTGAASLILLALVTASPITPWARLFNVVDPQLTPEAGGVALVCLSAFAVNIPLALVQRIQYAHQQVAQSNAWQAAGSLTSIVAIVTAVSTHAGPLAVIAAAVWSPPLVNLVNTFWYFGFSNPALTPRWRRVDRAAAFELVGVGMRFFLLSVLSSIALNLDAILVAHVMGLAAAAHYSIVARAFSAVSMLVTLICLPLWPANAEALTRGDLAWVRTITRRMAILSSTVVSGGGLILVLFGRALLSAWLRTPVANIVTQPLLVAMALSCVLVAATSPLFMVQNSIGLLGPQFVGWSGFLILSVTLKLALMPAFGLAGVAIGHTIAFAVALVPAAVVGNRQSLARSGRGQRPGRHREVDRVGVA